MKRYTISIDEKQNPDIARWLEQQKNVSGAVRSLIARHLAGDTAEQPAAQLDLSAIRAVVDAALDEKLRGLSIAVPAGNSQHNDELDIFNDLLE